MKYYIVLQPSIRSMGGEEMYTRNILISARQMGYEPIVFHSGIGDYIYIDELKQFDQFVFPEFRYELCVIPEKKKQKLLNKIHSILGNYDEGSIIESHEILIAEWGELIANELKVKHFAYMLLEHNRLSYKPLYDLFKFKYDRNELAGFEEETIPDMFYNYQKHVKGVSLPAFCGNSYEDIPCRPDYKVGKADYTIGSIGRTNKQYVLPMVDSIVKFVSKYPDKSFNMLYVGGSMDKTSEKNVIRGLASCPNMKLFFTGMTFPLSVEMIKQMDVCIASTDSCFISYNCGIPTVCVDGNDSKAIGIFKVTTQNPLFRSKDEPPIEIEKLLDDVLLKKMYIKEERLQQVKIDFSSHWEFIKGMEQKRDYFDVSKIRYPLKRRLISLLLGYYYGLSPLTFRYTIIKKCISLFA